MDCSQLEPRWPFGVISTETLKQTPQVHPCMLPWGSELRLAQGDTPVALQGLKQSSLESLTRILPVTRSPQEARFYERPTLGQALQGGLHILPTEAQVDLWGQSMSNVEIIHLKLWTALPKITHTWEWWKGDWDACLSCCPTAFLCEPGDCSRTTFNLCWQLFATCGRLTNVPPKYQVLIPTICKCYLLRKKGSLQMWLS